MWIRLRSCLIHGLNYKYLMYFMHLENPLSSFTIEGKISCGELIEPNLILGTYGGVLRFYNIADIRQPVLFKIIKLYIEKPISFISS